jgi:hypothetical protein
LKREGHRKTKSGLYNYGKHEKHEKHEKQGKHEK